jgi:FixJ family two-component response regulator
VLDVELPDVNGLDLLDQTGERHHPHVVFITGHGDIPTSVRAIKAGAVDFLTKPLKEADLIRAIHDAIAKDRIAMREMAELAALRRRLFSCRARNFAIRSIRRTGTGSDNGNLSVPLLRSYGRSCLGERLDQRIACGIERVV